MLFKRVQIIKKSLINFPYIQLTAAILKIHRSMAHARGLRIPHAQIPRDEKKCKKEKKKDENIFRPRTFNEHRFQGKKLFHFIDEKNFLSLNFVVYERQEFFFLLLTCCIASCTDGREKRKNFFLRWKTFKSSLEKITKLV